MKNLTQLFLIISLALVLMYCSDTPCEGLDGGAYVYPNANGKSLEETFQLYKIPEPVLQCMPTDGLIQSCIEYPEMRMVWTRNSLQQGFDYIEDKCNGFEELWRREDKFQTLADLYSMLDFERDWTKYSALENGSYEMNIIYHELILAQNDILQDLTANQKLELFELVLNKLKIKVVKYEEFGGLGMAGSIAILSKIMLNEQYPPFIEKYEDDINFMQAVELILGIEKSECEEIIVLSSEFLEFLRTEI